MEEMKCPVCHKAFIVPNKRNWAYRKNSQLICSWTCLRAMELKTGEDKGMRTKVPEEAKQEAIRIALDGGNPITVLEPYTRNPKAMWWAIKAKLKETDPETFAKLPDLRNVRKQAKEEKPATAADAMAACQDTADEFFGKCQEMGLLKDQPKAPEMEYNITGIRTEMGDFQYYRKSGFLDWTPNEATDTVSMNTDEWRQLMEDLPKIMDVLGVKL